MTTVPTNQAFNTHYGKIKNNNTEHLIQHVVQQNNVTLFNFSISGVDVTDGLLSVTCDTVTGDQVIYSLDLEDDRAELSTDIYNYAVGGTVEIFLSVVWNLYLTVAEVDYDDIPDGEVDSEAIALLQARIKKLEKDLKDAQDDLAEAEEDLVATAALLSDAEDDLSAAQSQLGACQENNTTLTGQLSACQSTNTTLQAQVTQLEADLAAAQSSGGGSSTTAPNILTLGDRQYAIEIIAVDTEGGNLYHKIKDLTTNQFLTVAEAGFTTRNGAASFADSNGNTIQYEVCFDGQLQASGTYGASGVPNGVNCISFTFSNLESDTVIGLKATITNNNETISTAYTTYTLGGGGN